MLPVAQLGRMFARLPPVEYRKNLFRTVRLKFLGTPLSGIGAVKTGARFTPVGGPETIYLAEDPLTAFAEYHHVNLSLIHDLDDPFIARLAVVAVVVPRAELDPTAVLDLTRPEVRGALGTDLVELSSAWAGWTRPGLPPTQILGREAHVSGLFQAIRFPSARNPGGICLAVFPDRLPKGGPAYLDLDDSVNGGPVQRVP
jgi:RES domain-containing protein